MSSRSVPTSCRSLAALTRSNPPEHRARRRRYSDRAIPRNCFCRPRRSASKPGTTNVDEPCHQQVARLFAMRPRAELSSSCPRVFGNATILASSATKITVRGNDMKTLAHCIGVALCALLLQGSAPAAAHECDSADGGSSKEHDAMRCHRNLPLVYPVENTGAHFPVPVFPTFDQLPIIRPLPDPFVFFDDGRRGDDGRRDASFESWERRRNEIKAAIET